MVLTSLSGDLRQINPRVILQLSDQLYIFLTKASKTIIYNCVFFRILVIVFLYCMALVGLICYKTVICLQYNVYQEILHRDLIFVRFRDPDIGPIVPC